MLNKELETWIKQEEEKGYSDEQIKKAMITKGYKKEDMKEYFDKKYANNKKGFKALISLIKSKGTLFSIIFYLLTTWFYLESVVLTIFLSTQGNIIIPLIDIIMILWITYELYQLKLKETTIIMLMIFPFSILILATNNIIQSFMRINNSSFYMALITYSLITGFLFAFSLNKVIDDKTYKIYPVIFSTLIAFIYGINKVTGILIQELKLQFEQLGQAISNNGAGTGASIGSITNMFSSEIINPEMGFLITLIGFNAFFIYYLYKREEFDKKMLFWYLLPIIIYLATYLGLNFLSHNIIMV